MARRSSAIPKLFLFFDPYTRKICSGRVFFGAWKGGRLKSQQGARRKVNTRIASATTDTMLQKVRS